MGLVDERDLVYAIGDLHLETIGTPVVVLALAEFRRCSASLHFSAGH